MCRRAKLFAVLVVVLFVDEGIEDPNTTISGPISAHQRNAI